MATRYAERFLSSRLQRGEAMWMAVAKARQKGVDDVALQQAEEAITGQYDAAEACRQLIRQRDPQALRHHDTRVWQRHARFLQNKGFDTATILRVLNEQDSSLEEG